MQSESFVAWWWRALRRRWLVGAALFLVVSSAGAALLLLAHPIYRADSKLRLGEPPPMGGVSPTGGFFGLLRLGGDPFANDLELLASRTLAEGVVDDVALNVRLRAPRGWHRDSLITALSADRTTRKATFDVAWSGNAVVIRPTRAGDVVRATPGVPVTFGGVTITFRAWRAGMPRKIVLQTVSHGEATRVAGGRIDLERARRDANVVRIVYQDADPAVTHGVVSSVVSRFTALRTSIMRRESGETVDSLRIIAEQTRAELTQAERSLEELQRSTRLVAPEAQAEAAIERYSETGAQLELARMELAALDAALGRADEASSAAGAWSALLAYPRFLDNATLADLIEKLTTLEQQRRELAWRRTVDNPEHRAVLDQIAYLDQSLRVLARDYRSALALQLSSLEQQVAALTTSLSGVPQQAIALARRQRDARVLAEVVVLTEQRLRQEQIRQALTFANVQVIDPPGLRDRPVWPRRKLGMAVVLLLAGGTALVGMAAIERADSAVRRADDVRALLHAPVLGVVHRYRNAAPTLTVAEVAAVIRRGVVEEPGRAHIVLASIDDETLARAAADALIGGVTLPHDEMVPLAQPEITLLQGIDDFAAAAAAAGARAPIVLVLHGGRTVRSSISRAVGLLADAGATIAGALIVCDRPREAAEVWS